MITGPVAMIGAISAPSGDRTASSESNSVTFLMSNMLPQAPALNRGLWAKFEDYCRDQLKGGANEEYIVCGGAGSLNKLVGGKVNVPALCWKVVAILTSGENDLGRFNTNTRLIAVLVPNDGPATEGKTWRDFLVSIDQVEAATGYDFFSNIPHGIQDVIEAKTDSGRASAQTKDSAVARSE